MLFFVLSLGLHAQKDTIYADENDFPISKEIFNKKLSAPIYYGLRFDTDTLVLQKIKLKFYIGELESNTKHQLFKLLNKRHQIDTTKVLIIHYSDTLKLPNEFPKRNYVVFKDSLDNIVKVIQGPTTFVDLNKIRSVKKQEHFWSYKTFIREQKKCMKSHVKYKDEAQVLHFYNQNNGHPEKLNELRWYKDYGLVIKKILMSIENEFDVIIIHPDGDFYVQKGYLEFYYPYKDLIEKRNWETHNKAFLEKMKI